VRDRQADRRRAAAGRDRRAGLRPGGGFGRGRAEPWATGSAGDRARPRVVAATTIAPAATAATLVRAAVLALRVREGAGARRGRQVGAARAGPWVGPVAAAGLSSWRIYRWMRRLHRGWTSFAAMELVLLSAVSGSP
jgi:hypothetical protein